MPSSRIAAASSPIRWAPSASSRSAVRRASEGGMTSPSSPSVHVTRVTWAPSAAYLAMVAPLLIDSSSGCACTSSRRRAGRSFMGIHRYEPGGPRAPAPLPPPVAGAPALARVRT
ncbi:hypothetical protein SBADM41S_02390 [Streptomyces badius]